jgi:hypothetical protein
MEINEKATPIEAEIEGNKITITPYILEKSPKHTIIGIDTIIKHPELLKTQYTKKPKANPRKIKIHQLSVKLQEQLKTIFNTEIDPTRLCTVEKHKIKTEEHSPIVENNFRIPIHYEKNYIRRNTKKP